MVALIAAFSYSLAAFAFLLLFALLLIRWHGRKHGASLAIACLVTAGWAAAVAYFARHGTAVTLATSLLEIAKNAAWAAFLLGLLRHKHEAHLFASGLSRRAAAFACAYGLMLVATLLSGAATGLQQGIAGFIAGSFGHIGMAVMGMLLVEELFRNAGAKERWAIKFACLGIGGLFAYDFYFYVDALLFKQADAEIWTARGIVNAFAVPLIAVSAARNPDWSVGISVSRRVLFHSATLIGSALYLLVVAAAGYYLRFFGGEWGTALQTAFLFAALISLAAVLISGTFRSWLRVSISKHFYSYGYDYREEWLKFTRTLSAAGPGLGERAIRAIAELVESPKGILYGRGDADDYVIRANWNLDLRGTAEPESDSLCTFLKKTHWVIDIEEYEATPEKYEGLSLPDWVRTVPHARLIVPLMQNEDLFGFVILAQPRSKIALNWEVLDLLKIVGIQAASYLARQESSDALAVARQFETFNRMSTFVVHDLKNVVSQLGLLLANAEKHKDSPEFQKDMLETIEHSVQKMRLLLQKFNRESSNEQSSRVRLDKLLQQAVVSKSAAEPKPSLAIRSPGLTVSASPLRLERVIGHLVQNAMEATPRDGRVEVIAFEQEYDAVIEVIDTGRGMSGEFIRERLFKPFESTKAAGMGIGVFEAREYVHQIGGRLEVESAPGKGTRFRVILPLHRQDEDRLTSAA